MNKKKTLYKRQIWADTVALKPPAVVQNSDKKKNFFCARTAFVLNVKKYNVL